MAHDPDLLFGALSLTGGLIDSGQFVEACSEWLAQRNRPLAELLIERGWITPEERRDLETRIQAGHDLTATQASNDKPSSEARTRDFSTHFQPPLESSPRAQRPRTLRPLGDAPPTSDRYRLNHIHAVGGIGEIWSAHDCHLGRDVALKVLRQDRRAGAQYRSRFLAEARINGQLEHPGIVPVYDLADGRDGHEPFYVMRFAGGRTLADALKQHHEDRAAGRSTALDLLGLLNAFVSVCNAVAFAHNHKVIHRDLKPRNVVLGDFGEVFLLDWGLAKRLDATETRVPPNRRDEAAPPGEEQTLDGQVLGTLGYMAPEQAEGDPARVGPWSDIFGLGAILYEILTGVPPYQEEDTRKLIAQVRLAKPVRPRALNPRVPQALEAVCLKAMSASPNGRYSSATELAREVQRWLADEPVEAAQDPLSVRAGRWTRRHRTLVASALLVLLTTVVALGLSNWRIRREERQTLRAVEQASSNLSVARAAVDDMLLKVADNALVFQPQTEVLRKYLAERSAKCYRDFLRVAGDDPVIQRDASQVFRRVANIERLVNDSRAARSNYDQSIRLLEGLVRQRPEEREYQDMLAETLSDYAAFLELAGELTRAEETCRRALDLARVQHRRSPTLTDAQRTLGRTLVDHAGLLLGLGKFQQAVQDSAEAVALLTPLADTPGLNPADPLLCVIACHQNGLALLEAGQPDKARSSLEGAIDRARRLKAANEDDANARFLLARALVEHGRLLGEINSFNEAIEELHRLTELYPKYVAYPKRLAQAYIARGRFLVTKEDSEASQHDFQAALATLQPLLETHPEMPEYWTYQGLAKAGLGQIALIRGDNTGALRLLEEAEAAHRSALEKNPESKQDWDALRDVTEDLKRVRSTERDSRSVPAQSDAE